LWDRPSLSVACQAPKAAVCLKKHFYFADTVKIHPVALDP